MPRDPWLIRRRDGSVVDRESGAWCGRVWKTRREWVGIEYPSQIPHYKPTRRAAAEALWERWKEARETR